LIRFFFHPTPNSLKIALFFEETAMPFELVPVDTRKGEQHLPDFLAVNPNGKLPAIVDSDGPGGTAVRVFDSTAILLYLAEKRGAELLAWLLFVASGLGPYSGQAVHFQRAAPEPLPYAVNRYRREVERHYEVLDRHLQGRAFMVGSRFTIADISTWGWIDRAAVVLAGDADPLDAYPRLQQWFRTIDARPAVARARRVGADHVFKTEVDDVARRALYPSNYPRTAR